MPKYRALDGTRVSQQWWRLLTAARKDGVDFHVNSGHRTLAEQAALFRQNMVRPGVPKPGRPLTAFPSPFAPHIRVGRADHAIDVQDENLFAEGGGAERLMDWARDHGVTIVRPVATEAWHLEADAGGLRRFAAKARAREQRRRERLARKPAHSRVLSEAGVELIARFEGFVPYAYNDPVGLATAGYGHLIGRRPVNQADRDKYGTKEHPKLSKKEALALLKRDARVAEEAVRVSVLAPLRQQEYDALVSFVFNVGTGAFADSTLLRELNRRHYLRAANELLRWNRAGGRVLLGLSRRRRAERRMFRSR